MDTFHAQILTPEGSIFDGNVTGVKMPGSLGSFEVKQNHANLVSSLDIGEIRVRKAEEGDDQYIAVAGGFVEVNNNKLTLLAEIAEPAADIDVERAEKAKENAAQKLQEKKSDRKQLEKSLRKAKNRLNVANRL